MWATFRTSIFNKDHKQKSKGSCTDQLTVNDEYLSAIRTKSFVDFFFKVQLMVKNPSSSSASLCSTAHSRLSSSDDILLNPGQETIATLLESSPVFSKNSCNNDLKSLLTNYFDISAQASNFCSRLLKSLSQIQSDYTVIHQLIATVDLNSQFGAVAVSELQSRVIVNNPSFSKKEFNRIHEKHSLILQHLRFKRKGIARKIKLIRCFNKASGVCVTAACGVIAAAAVFLAVHTLTALVMGPAVFIFPVGSLKRKVSKFGFLKHGFLTKIVKQLDVAAKGAYILNRDFDTMSRLVTRLQDEVEHNRVLIRFCLDRSSCMQEDNRVCCQMLKEIKKCELGLRKQVEELEEHVYLCLVTINRARALVVEEICKDSCEQKNSVE